MSTKPISDEAVKAALAVIAEAIDDDLTKLPEEDIQRLMMEMRAAIAAADAIREKEGRAEQPEEVCPFCHKEKHGLVLEPCPALNEPKTFDLIGQPAGGAVKSLEDLAKTWLFAAGDVLHPSSEDRASALAYCANELLAALRSNPAQAVPELADQATNIRTVRER